MGVTTLELEPGLMAHASGALWLPETGVALVADAHLGYGWAQRRRGALGPVRDSASDKKLAAMMDELQPKKIVFLGDLVHAPKPAPGERAAIEETLRAILNKTEVIAVRGNHDRAFGRDFAELGIPVVMQWRHRNLVAIHGDRVVAVGENERAIAGHFHPAFGLRDAAGAYQRLPVFLISQRAIILPAFSPFAAGFDVRDGMPGEAQELLATANPAMVAASGKRVVSLGCRQ